VEQTREIEDFDAVVRLYWPKVFRFALASLSDRDAAESLAQECFLKAYLARRRFRGEASLNTWLMQIAVNLVRDSIRSASTPTSRKRWMTSSSRIACA
jgi:RNA polymerase sigma-70 factor (ECF subfamily)